MTDVSQGSDRPKARAAVWLALIIILGFGLRITGLIWGQAYCYSAQADCLEAYSVAVDYGLGVPSTAYLGQPNFNSHAKLPGPLWSLFCWVCCRLWGSVEGIVIGIILLNTAAIGLTYLLAHRTIGPAGALWAALLAATLPWVVYYSVGVYNPNVMPFLGALLFLALWQVVRVDRSPSIFWVPVILLVMLQFHMSGLMLLPAILLVLLLSRPRLHVPWLLGGLAAGLALYLPYLRGEFAHGWQNTAGMLRGDPSFSWDALKALSAPLAFLANWAPEWSRDFAEYRDMGRACFGTFGFLLAVNALSAVIAGFLLVGAFLEVKAAMRGFWVSPREAFARASGLLFLTILFLVPLLDALVSGKTFRTRYCLVVLPAMLPLAAVAAVRWAAAPRLGRAFRVGFIFTCCASIWLVSARNHFLWRQIETGPDFVAGFRNMERVYQSVKAHAGSTASVRIDPDAFQLDQSVSEAARHDILLLCLFVSIREKENEGRFAAPHGRAYRVCRAGQAKQNDPLLAYCGNGIALVAASPAR